MKTQRFLRSLLIMLALANATACAPTSMEIPPPTMEARAHFGTVGVLPVRMKTDREEFRRLDADIASGEIEGAIEGGIWAFEPSAEICGTIMPTAGAAVTCVGAILYSIAATPVAATVGAIRSRPAEEVKIAKRNLLAGFQRMNPSNELRDQVVFVGNTSAGIRILALQEGNRDALPSGQKQINSIMTLFYEWFLLFDDDNMRPSVTLGIQLTASLARVEDDTPLHTQIWRYWSEEEDFFELAEDDAKRLDQVIAKAYERLAKKTVHDLFVTSSPEMQEPGQRGAVWTVETSSFYSVANPVPPLGSGAQ
jgi:hypothetical protein